MFEYLNSFPIWIIAVFAMLFTLLSILTITTLINIVFGPYLNNAPKLMTFPKVSLLVPARNEEHNIRRCIESLLRQDYPDFEIIVLDDNSTDKTYQICEEYKSISNFKIIKGGELQSGWLEKTMPAGNSQSKQKEIF
jgi:chlorobactene glucosyltransferase